MFHDPLPRDNVLPNLTAGEYGGIGAFVTGKEWVPNGCSTYLHVSTPHDEATTYIAMTQTIISYQKDLSVVMYTQLTDLEVGPVASPLTLVNCIPSTRRFQWPHRVTGRWQCFYPFLPPPLASISRDHRRRSATALSTTTAAPSLATRTWPLLSLQTRRW